MSDQGTATAGIQSDAVAASLLPPPEMRAHLASPDGSRRLFSGEPEEIAAKIRSCAAIGVHELIFDGRGQSITESIERLQWFATDVIPLVDE